ncbi:class A beta-lactamase-related serine hydrolase [Myxococcus sp. K15C18031901]|uniref:serine hydrolase n=1 Tax=Myxococcus dinghuensis TaxID=2906761 RepID=UPI0020A7C1B9|nr:serine hydrolase [Myxococcus dinghuensis]MCP3102375.1 class A beta-lactamase-related serine hydrolase [Myxococcus dinghuensis]
MAMTWQSSRRVVTRSVLVCGLVAGAALAGPPAASGPGARVSLQSVVDALMVEAARLTPGTDVAIAVRDLRTGEYAGASDAVPHVSASAAKVFWVAAALKKADEAKVAPLAEKVFRTSDNEASGEVIDLVGGPDAVNVYLRSLGVKNTALTKWNYGKPRRATNSPQALGNDNYLCAVDAVSFLQRLEGGALLKPGPTSRLLGWMELTPREGCGGWLGTLLPAKARASLRHKAGWLPPGCCSDDTRYNVLNDVGLVQLPEGGRYAVAILAARGPDWPRQAFFVERASCVLYRALSGAASLDCGESLAEQGGPTPVRVEDGGTPPDYDC